MSDWIIREQDQWSLASLRPIRIRSTCQLGDLFKGTLDCEWQRPNWSIWSRETIKDFYQKGLSNCYWNQMKMKSSPWASRWAAESQRQGLLALLGRLRRRRGLLSFPYLHIWGVSHGEPDESDCAGSWQVLKDHMASILSRKPRMSPLCFSHLGSLVILYHGQVGKCEPSTLSSIS